MDKPITVTQADRDAATDAWWQECSNLTETTEQGIFEAGWDAALDYCASQAQVTVPDGLAERVTEKHEQAKAALRNLHGLPALVTESDTQRGKSAIWMDNGLAGVGQVAISTGEFPCKQTEALAALVNVAATIPFDAILSALGTAQPNSDGLALEAYRAAISWVASDSWDGCSDCIEMLKRARSVDDFHWSPDDLAHALRRLNERAGRAALASKDNNHAG